MHNPEHPQVPFTRRELLVQGVRSVESLAFCSSLFVGMVSNVRDTLRSTMHVSDVGYEENRRLQLTDQRHSHRFGEGSIRNVGVNHNSQFLEVERFHKHITQVIDECDVLLLEGAAREYERHGAFFTYWREEALARKKTVFDIDYIRRNLFAIQKNYSLTFATGTGMGMLMNDVTDHTLRWYKNVPLRLCTARRNILRVLGLTLWGSAYTLRHSDADVLSSEQQEGYVIRGRSAKMMEGILLTAQRYPEAHIATLTGEGHARLLELYFSDQELLKKDLESYRILNAIYHKGLLEVKSDD